MSYFKRMIYKGGKLSARKADQALVSNLDELMEKVGDGFLPLGCEDVKGLVEIPELKILMELSAQKQKRAEKALEMVEEVPVEEEPVEEKPVIKKRRARRKK